MNTETLDDADFNNTRSDMHQNIDPINNFLSSLMGFRENLDTSEGPKGMLRGQIHYLQRYPDS